MATNTIVITGGTGLVGSALASHLVGKGYKVVILTRNPAKQPAAQAGISYAAWDVDKQTIDPQAIANAHAIVHLAGAGVVAKPWTEAYKTEIVTSRVNSSALLAKALKEIPNQVQTFISTSAIGYYGPDKTGKHFVEEDKPVRTFLAETCRLWEQSVQPIKALGIRLVINRLGIVLSNRGGALAEFKKPLQFRVAGVLGGGRQIVSWIHINDLCRMIQYELENTALQGVYNAVSPQPVSNKTLTIALANAMHGNGFITLPVPAFVLKLLMGDRSTEVLKSTTVSANKIIAAGFRFDFASIQEAIQTLQDARA